MKRLLPLPCALAWLITLAGPGAARAQSVETPIEVPAANTWEGAFGLTSAYRPEFQGASRQVFKVTPALFLRYGRLTVTNASGFVTRRSDDVVRGLGLDLNSSDKFRASLALRFDAGRSEDTSAELKGTGDIGRTVRLRLSLAWTLDDGWRAGASWNLDALGRGGGTFGDLSIGHQQRLGAATTLTLGSSLAAGGDRFMQSYYGITEAQAARSGYPVYHAASGLRDVSLYGATRTELDQDWVVLAGASVSRLLGPAAASPLTRSRSGWGVNAGIARRF